MENFLVFIIVFIGFILFLIYIRIITQEKGTTSEKIGNAVSDLAQNTANQITRIASTLTESTENRKNRLAKENIAERNSLLYDFNWYGSNDYLKQLLTIDEHLKKSLEVLNIPEKTWRSIAIKIFYIGTMWKLSYHDRKGINKNTVSIREDIINGTSPFSQESKYLTGALDYYGIPYKEWIIYGDAVLVMHGLYDDIDIKKYGYCVKFRPACNPNDE